jgi:hypothetical protein
MGGRGRGRGRERLEFVRCVEGLWGGGWAGTMDVSVLGVG